MMMVQDPVCRRAFDLDGAVAAVDHGGWAYFFCSERCCRAFQADPDRYAAQAPRPPWRAAAAAEGT